jgi:hypothetical protein
VVVTDRYCIVERRSEEERRRASTLALVVGGVMGPVLAAILDRVGAPGGPVKLYLRGGDTPSLSEMREVTTCWASEVPGELATVADWPEVEAFRPVTFYPRVAIAAVRFSRWQGLQFTLRREAARDVAVPIPPWDHGRIKRRLVGGLPCLAVAARDASGLGERGQRILPRRIVARVGTVRESPTGDPVSGVFDGRNADVSDSVLLSGFGRSGRATGSGGWSAGRKRRMQLIASVPCIPSREVQVGGDALPGHLRVAATRIAQGERFASWPRSRAAPVAPATVCEGEADGDGEGEGDVGAVAQAPSVSPWATCAGTAGDATLIVWPLWQIVTLSWPKALTVPSSEACGRLALGATGASGAEPQAESQRTAASISGASTRLSGFTGSS